MYDMIHDNPELALEIIVTLANVCSENTRQVVSSITFHIVKERLPKHSDINNSLT
jgi:hypothetical protein